MAPNEDLAFGIVNAPSLPDGDTFSALRGNVRPGPAGCR